MPWASAFLPVPTGYLRVDPAVATNSPKGYTAQDLQAMVRPVPDVYRSLLADPSGRAGGNSPEEIATRKALFDPSSSTRLVAELDHGALSVVAGNHRVRAAQQCGVPVLPVLVKAPTQQEVNELTEGLRRSLGPDYRSLVEVHERLDQVRARPLTAQPQRTDRSRRGPDRTGP